MLLLLLLLISYISFHLKKKLFTDSLWHIQMALEPLLNKIRVTFNTSTMIPNNGSDNADEYYGSVAYTAWICWTKGLFTSWMGWSRMTWDFIMLFRTTCNLKCILINWYISGIFHLIFSNLNWPQVNDTTRRETTDKRGLLYYQRLRWGQTSLILEVHHQKGKC